MGTDRMMKTTLMGLSFVCLVGCVMSTQTEKTAISMPAEWSVVSPAEPDTCAAIDGSYKIFGLGRQREGAPLEKRRLDAALGYEFPSNKMPDQVNIAVDKESNMLNISFGDPVNRVFSESVSCANGWYEFEKKMTDQYLGDGGYLDYLFRYVSLGKDSDGSLIVHLKLDGQFSTFAVIKSREVTESWSKYMTSE